MENRKIEVPSSHKSRKREFQRRETGVKMRKESVQKHFPEVKTKFTQ